MGNFTIKGLAKANECETHDANGLASLWGYWLACNCNDMQSVNDFKLLRKAERREMLEYLRGFDSELYSHIIRHII